MYVETVHRFLTRRRLLVQYNQTKSSTYKVVSDDAMLEKFESAFADGEKVSVWRDFRIRTVQDDGCTSVMKSHVSDTLPVRNS